MASTPYNLSGYIADADHWCHACMVEEYSGRVGAYGVYRPDSYDNRGAVIRALRHAEAHGPYDGDIREHMQRYIQQYNLETHQDDTIRNMRSWSDSVGVAVCWLDVELLDHEGNTISPFYKDQTETEYPISCCNCNKELDTIVLCHIDDRWADGDCECIECKEALEEKDQEQEIRQDIRDYLQEARQYRKEIAADPECVSYRKYSLQRAYQSLRVQADTLSRILYMTKRPYRWARKLERGAANRSYLR